MTEQSAAAAAVKAERRKVELPPLDQLDTYEAVPTKERTEFAGAGRPPTEQELKMRKQVRDSYESWVTAGKPDKMVDCPQKRYIVEPKFADGTRQLLRNSAKAIKVGMRIDPVNHQHAHNGKATGLVMVYWCATDPRVYTERAKPETAATPTQSAVK